MMLEWRCKDCGEVISAPTPAGLAQALNRHDDECPGEPLPSKPRTRVLVSWLDLAELVGAERVVPLKSPSGGWPSISSRPREGEYQREKVGKREMWILELPHEWEIQVSWNPRFKSWDVVCQAPGGGWRGVAVKGRLEAALEVGRFIY